MEKLLLKTETWKALDNNRVKKGGNPALELLHIEKNFIETCDGKTLLRWLEDIDIIEPGLYSVIAAKKHNAQVTEIILEKNEGTEFADTNSIINPLKDTASKLTIAVLPDKMNLPSISKAIIQLYEFTKKAFCYTLLNKISCLSLIWHVISREDKSEIMLKNDSFIFIISPFKM